MARFQTHEGPAAQAGYSLTQLPKSIRRLGSDTRGAAIVEFAIVSLPFFMLLCAILQTGLLFFEQQILQTATTDAARLILTGQAQANGLSQAQFKTQLCSELPSFMPCGLVTIDVRTQTSFDNAQATKPVDSSGKYDPSKAMYSIGTQKQIVVVSAYALQPIFFPIVSPFMGTAGGGNALISASAAFRNEPWKQ